MRRNLTKQQTNKNRSREKSFRRAARYVDWSLNLDLFAIHTSMYTPNTYSYTRMQILRTLFYLAVDPFDFEAERNSRRRNTVSSNRENFSFYEKEKTTALLYSSHDDECRHRSTKVDVSMNPRKKKLQKVFRKRGGGGSEKPKVVKRFIPNVQRRNMQNIEAQSVSCFSFTFHVAERVEGKRGRKKESERRVEGRERKKGCRCERGNARKRER